MVTHDWMPFSLCCRGTYYQAWEGEGGGGGGRGGAAWGTRQEHMCVCHTADMEGGFIAVEPFMLTFVHLQTCGVHGDTKPHDLSCYKKAGINFFFGLDALHIAPFKLVMPVFFQHACSVDELFDSCEARACCGFIRSCCFLTSNVLTK